MEGGGRNRIGRREKWPKKSWEEGEIGGKCREEGKLAQKVGRFTPLFLNPVKGENKIMR